MPGTRVAALVAAGCVVLSGCAVASDTSGAARAVTPQNPTTSLDVVPVAYTSTMKPAVLGNSSRSLGAISGSTAALSARVNAVTVSLDWKNLEPTEGSFNDTPINNALASADAKGLTIRLRVIAGTQAPDFAKRVGGSPIPFYDHQAKQDSTIGRFWTSAYQAKWQAFMTHLAATYDGNRLVREVNISGTGAISAETMLTMGNDTLTGSTITNNDRLLAAGATETARRTALMNDITFMQRTWKQTHTTLFCSPYVTLAPKPKSSLATTEEIVAATYASDPGHTVFGHTGASSTTLRGITHATVLEMYEFFIANHYPFMAQTQAYSGGAKNEGVGDLSYVITWLAAHGAYSIELPSGWQYDSGALRVMPGTTRRMVASSTRGGLASMHGA
jgi:hypothetical protein